MLTAANARFKSEPVGRRFALKSLLPNQDRRKHRFLRTGNKPAPDTDYQAVRPPSLTPQSPLKTLTAAFLSWFESLVVQEQRSKSTLANYKRGTQNLGFLGDLPVAAIRCSDVLEWYEGRCKVATSATAFMEYTVVRVVLAWARRRDLVPTNVACALGIGHRAGAPRPVQPEEIAPWRTALAKQLERRHHYVAARPSLTEVESVGLFSSLRVLQLLEVTGRRISEICTIRVEHVWLTSRAILLPQTKTGPSAIPLTDSAVELCRGQLEVLAGRSPYLFPSPVGWHRPIHKKTVWEACHETFGLAGISGASPHDLRHGFAAAVLLGGGRMDSLSKTMGHRNVKTTQQRYGGGVYLTPDMWVTADLAETVKRGTSTADDGGSQ